MNSLFCRNRRRLAAVRTVLTARQRVNDTVQGVKVRPEIRLTGEKKQISIRTKKKIHKKSELLTSSSVNRHPDDTKKSRKTELDVN